MLLTLVYEAFTRHLFLCVLSISPDLMPGVCLRQVVDIPVDDWLNGGNSA